MEPPEKKSQPDNNDEQLFASWIEGQITDEEALHRANSPVDLRRAIDLESALRRQREFEKWNDAMSRTRGLLEDDDGDPQPQVVTLKPVCPMLGGTVVLPEDGDGK